MSGKGASPRPLGEGDRAQRGGVGIASATSKSALPPPSASRPPPPEGEERRAWSDALRVAALLAADPHGCGGIVLRAGAGPVRELWLDAFRAALAPGTPWRRLPPGIGDDRLLGGLDLAATLRAGRPVAQTGLLVESDGGIVVVPMAERLEAGLVAKLCAALDTGTVALERDGLRGSRPARFGLVLLDEGGEDEAVAEALGDRMAFRIDLSGVGWRDVGDAATAFRSSKPRPHPEVPARSGGLEGDLQQPLRSLEPSFEAADAAPQDEDEGGIDIAATLCAAAADLGIASLRGPLLAARVARLAAAGAAVTEAGVIEAARLVLAPRAKRLPPAEAPEPPPQQPEPPESGEPPPDDAREPDAPQTLEDLVLEAARAGIPPNLLAALLAGGPRLRTAKAGRMGAASAAPRSGRPAGSRPGDPRRGRLDLIATLRAAAPWQRVRQRSLGGPSFRDSPEARTRNPRSGTAPDRGFRVPLRGPGMTGGELRSEPQAPIARRIVVLPDDLRIKRLVKRSETTTIFVVDASGSAALERLAEAKGAVELLLAEAYVRRDRVALIAFRGAGADLLLPPTRSLVRAKRTLSGLPGGGGTPLAAGLDAAAALALAVRRGGGSPILVVLTDGRANVARSGEGGRAKAGEEALAAARVLHAENLRALVIDTGARPEAARRLAEAAQARYIPLPYADAGSVSAAVRAATA